MIFDRQQKKPQTEKLIKSIIFSQSSKEGTNKPLSQMEDGTKWTHQILNRGTAELINLTVRNILCGTPGKGLRG